MSAFLLLSRDGRRYIVPDGIGLVRVKGLGIVDRNNLSATGYGTNVSIAGKAFLLLPPTLDDLLDGLSRGPQIIMAKDAAQIIHCLSIHSGSRVVEGGSGSGSLTIALLHAVFPLGEVVTVELRTDHIRLARENVTGCGLQSCWRPVIADVRKPLLPDSADAMVLDMPDPWEALHAACITLRPGGMLAVYSPTINQTERTVVSAVDGCLLHEKSFEVILRKLEIASGASRHSFDTLGHTGYVSLFRKVAGSVSEIN
ncbi:MAG: hypothetical protein KIS30_03395 [Thermoplasmata archaeon]|nr:hypothetical protein [Candidatus Sysuiplasma acidicola]MBX8637950.1 hypothetical protein [Candidatus Sysuiplasma acidicola]MBX8645789.1 hypothetical protein [Candidatus Sysuiplasma acidicola]MDH2905868.1 hypothetical protein [Methanomassiliicoccales archaeon]